MLRQVLKVLNIVQLTIFISCIVFGIFMIRHPEYVIKKFADFLVIPAEPVKSDVVAVLSGNEGELRMQNGLELYSEGYGEALVLSGYTGVQGMTGIMEAMGIDPETVHVDQAQSTYENAVLIKEYMEEEDYQSVVIVTAPYQSRRAKMVFEHVMPQMDVSISYSGYHEHKSNLIFTSKAVRENFASESIKYLYYFIEYGLK